jgi:hypothetical protein
MSLTFIVHVDVERDPVEQHIIEFWPDQQRCQARIIDRCGVVTSDIPRPMPEVLAGLRAALTPTGNDHDHQPRHQGLFP